VAARAGAERLTTVLIAFGLLVLLAVAVVIAALYNS
jgi:hypothetical protein